MQKSNIPFVWINKGIVFISFLRQNKNRTELPQWPTAHFTECVIFCHKCCETPTCLFEAAFPSFIFQLLNGNKYRCKPATRAEHTVKWVKWCVPVLFILIYFQEVLFCWKKAKTEMWNWDKSCWASNNSSLMTNLADGLESWVNRTGQTVNSS